MARASLISSAADRRLLDDSRGTRAMVWIMAIMLFLTVLAAALGFGTLAGARGLDRQLAGRLTIQITAPVDATRDREANAVIAAVRGMPEVSAARRVDREALAALLRPWLGEDGADPDLPIPAMIDVDLTTPADAAIDRVTRAARAVAPSARIDRHEAWMAPVRQFMGVVTGLAFALVALMAAATAAVVILAGRAGLDTHRDTIAVLHMLGATDAQISRLFQRRIALDTLGGGIIGTMAGVGIVLLVGAQLAGLGSELMGGVVLDVAAWVSIAALPLVFAMLAISSARLAVMAALRQQL